MDDKENCKDDNITDEIKSRFSTIFGSILT